MLDTTLALRSEVCHATWEIYSVDLFVFTFVLDVQVQEQRAQSRYFIVVLCMWGVFNEVQEHVTFSLKYNECNVCAVL